MKNNHGFIASILFMGCCSLLSAKAQAQTTYYWDVTPQTVAPGNGSREGGGGVWNNTNANFTTSSTDINTVNHSVWNATNNGTGKDTVVFGGAAGGTVTLNQFANGGQIANSMHLAVNNLTFETSGYLLTGSAQIRFVNNGTTIGGSIIVNNGVTATINNAIQGNTSGALTSTTTGADGAVDTLVQIGGGGTLTLGGGNGSLGFLIGDGDVGTTVVAAGGSFSGWNLNTINANSILRMGSSNNTLQAPSSFTGAGLIDLNGTAQNTSTIGGTMAVTNSTSTGNAVLTLTLTNSTAVHTGAITNGTGKVSIATLGTLAQGSGFSSSNTFAQQTFAGVNTYTGSTSHGRGTIVLDFSNAAAPASNILYNNGFGPSPTGDDGKLIFTQPFGIIDTFNSSIGTLSSLTIVGKASTNNVQDFNGLRLNANSAGNVLINPNATANNITLNLGNIERNAGSFVNFATTAPTNALSPNVSIQTSSGSAGSILKDASGVAYATLGGRDWAAKDGSNSNMVAATYSAGAINGFQSNANISMSGNPANDTRLSADTTISTLRFDSSGRSSVLLGGNTLTTGGILVTADAGQSSGSTLADGVVKSAGTDLTVLHYASANNQWFDLGASVQDQLPGTGLTKGGTGITILSGTNSYTGALNVHQGGLVITGANTPNSVFINGSQSAIMGTQLAGNSTTGSFLQLGDGGETGSIGNGDIQLGVNALFAVKRSNDVTINNNIRGQGGFTQGGSGTTTMLSTNSVATAKYSYSGDTTVNAGTLKLDFSGGNNGIINDTSRLVLGGGTVEYAIAAGMTHNDVVRETVLNSGASNITKTGAGTGLLRLNAFNTQNAGSTLNFAAASIADTDATNVNGILGSVARFTVANSDWAVNSTNAGDGAVTALATYADFATGATTSNALITGSGTTTLTAGITRNTLKIDNSSGAIQTMALGTNLLTLTAGGLLVTGSDAVTFNGGTFRSNSATNSQLVIHQHNTSAAGLTINSVISNGAGTSTLTKSGNGLLTLSGTNTYTGQTFLNGGVTSISSNANLGSQSSGQQLSMSSATLRVTNTVGLFNGNANLNARNVALNSLGGTFDVVDALDTLTISGQIFGPGGLTKTGAGVLDIRQATYTGKTLVQQGTLAFGAEVNQVYSAFEVASGANLELRGGFSNTIGSLSGSGTVINTGDLVTLSVGALNTDTVFAGRLTNGSNGLNLQKIGAGTLTLTGGNNDYTGITTIAGGTLAIEGAGALPESTRLTLSGSTSKFNISGVTTAATTIASLSGTAGSAVELGASTLTLSPGFFDETFVFDGSISGDGGLVQEGTATQIFTGASSFTGGTIVNGGSVLANNVTGSALGSGAVTVGFDGTFGGTGAIDGEVILDGGFLSPGASIGTLTVGSASGLGTLLTEFDSVTQTFDLLQVTGDLNLDDMTLSFVDLEFGAGTLTQNAYVFVTYGSLSGTTNRFADVFDSPQGYNIDYAFGGNSIALVTAVPEPGTLAMLALAGVGGTIIRRRRRMATLAK